jgi:hypothetical protein
MNRHFFDEETIRRERLLDLYVRGLDHGDADAIATALNAALTDPQLNSLIDEIDQAYEEEERLSPLADEADTVRTLLRQHIPSAFEPPPHPAPLTVRDVASHLQSKNRVPAADSEAHRFLLNSDEPLPIHLSLIEIKKLAVKLKVKASDFYWKRFQQSAVALWMGRSQKQAQLAARSKRKSKDAAAQKPQGSQDSDSEKEGNKNDVTS